MQDYRKKLLFDDKILSLIIKYLTSEDLEIFKWGFKNLTYPSLFNLIVKILNSKIVQKKEYKYI